MESIDFYNFIQYHTNYCIYFIFQKKQLNPELTKILLLGLNDGKSV